MSPSRQLDPVAVLDTQTGRIVGIDARIGNGHGIWTEPEEFQPFMPTYQAEPNTEEVFRHA